MIFLLASLPEHFVFQTQPAHLKLPLNPIFTSEYSCLIVLRLAAKINLHAMEILANFSYLFKKKWERRAATEICPPYKKAGYTSPQGPA
jgi:hypothetical protein